MPKKTKVKRRRLNFINVDNQLTDKYIFNIQADYIYCNDRRANIFIVLLFNQSYYKQFLPPYEKVLNTTQG
jgi:hypothetical protein